MTNALTLFISDLHLKQSEPEMTQLFLQFLKTQAQAAESLYILGDFFEYWIGDDDTDPFYSEILEALKAYSAKIPTYFISGNRDFLVGSQFEARSGCVLLRDPTLITLYGKKIILSHGDILCTQDKAYQRFRKTIRHPIIQFLYGLLPLSYRQKLALKLRKKSETQKRQKPIPKEYMDVADSAVKRLFEDFSADILIHGHTHRAQIHPLNLSNGKSVSRIVLGDWNKQFGSVLHCTPHKQELLSFA